MKKHLLKLHCPECPYTNKGHIVEWKVGYTLTGTPSRPNNRKASDGGDVGVWQVKSPKASVAENDACKGYIFGFADSIFFYTMTRAEFEEFLTHFSYIDTGSKGSNGKKKRVRISDDSKRMRRYLEEHCEN